MSQDNIFREVEEELRSDRMRALWRKFGPIVIGAAIAIVVLVAVNEGWSWYTNSQSAAASTRLYSALDAAGSGDLAAAEQQLDALAADGSGGYPVLAEFRKAALLKNSGDLAGAVAAYDGLANDQANPRLRELALLLAANILVDSGTLADVEARVSTIAVEGNPLRRSAHELLGLAQYKSGDLAAAQASFVAILDDPLAPAQTRNRIAYYLAQMTSLGEIAADADTAASDAPADDAATTTPADAAPAPLAE